MSEEFQQSSDCTSISGTEVRTCLRALAALFLVASVVILSDYPFDDAYIHLRLARNLANHGQPFFNLGQPVLSGSSPLWVATLAGLFKISGHAGVETAITLEALSVVGLMLAAEAFLAHGRCRTWGSLGGAVVATLLALPSAGGLMETPLALALLVGGLALAQSEKWTWAGLIMGLAAATRFELVLPCAGALLLAPNARDRIRFFCGSAAVGITEALLLYSTFGTVLPNTLRAKAILYEISYKDLAYLAYPEFSNGIGALLILSLVIAPVAALAGNLRRRKRLCSPRIAWAIMAGFPVVLLGIYLAQTSMVFPWYWPLSLIPLSLATWKTATPGLPKVRTYMVPSLAAGLLLAASAFASPIMVGLGRLRAFPWVMENSRTKAYLQVGQFLNHHCPNAVLAAPEIGALGWTFPGRILDGCGLASPEILPYHPMRVPEERPVGGLGSFPARAIADFQPELVVGMETMLIDFRRRRVATPSLATYQPWFSAPVFVASLPPGLPRSLWGSARIEVFTCRPEYLAMPPHLNSGNI